uniref:MYND-type domain-containing protein n=1 Tax=Grammatophora oceanica TaxID=210454 RepID=A0A7S1V651_9STRA|eukprot:CAMPEP_0194028520 /NCGR_PEP_ID=MMETSP0009_2-20130614/2455_1 /TAXON_ID=210454 /ORGANISM="Grammatophora oceanica, Strain CCMP 410" /LENGTH=547 /DNA_ID=CAMNT_0038667933 /DNA_START=43 /DNA_END=1686 /DNA_ORIENTATION=+
MTTDSPRSSMMSSTMESNRIDVTDDALPSEPYSDRITITPWDSVPTRYGGSPTTTSAADACASLPRMVSLPKSASAKIKGDATAKNLYEKIINGGEFAFRYVFCKADDDDDDVPSVEHVGVEKKIDPAQFFLEVYETLESPSPPLIALKIKALKIDDKNEPKFYMSCAGKRHGAFFHSSSIRPTDFERLVLKVVHNILRHYGGLFVEREIPVFLVGFLKVMYSGKENHAPAMLMDLGICTADISLSYQNPSVSQLDIANVFCNLGTCLELLDDYGPAADFHERAACLTDSTTFSRQACHWVAAGLAFAQDGNFAKAEEAYYHCLHTKAVSDGRKFDVKDPVNRIFLANTIQMYAHVHSLGQPAHFWNDVDKLRFAYVTLVFTTSYEAPWPPVFNDIKGLREGIMNPELLTERGAETALLVAILQPTFDKYRKHLLENCLVPGMQCFLPNKSSHPDTPKNCPQYRDKILAQRIRTDGDRGKYELTCASCGTLEEEKQQFDCCPCKVMYYCSKKCQKEHWKNGGHKEECSWQAKKAARVGAARRGRNGN